MRTMNRKSTLAGVLGGFSTCALLGVSAMGQNQGRGQIPALEQVGDSITAVQSVRTPPSPITGEGGIAGLSPIIHDNGPVVTTTCNGPVSCAPNVHSSLQNVAPISLNVFGFTSLGPTFAIGDDFTLTATTDLQQIEFYSYNTGAITPTITGGSVTLLTDNAGAPGTPVPGCGPTTTLFAPVSLTNVARLVQAAGGTCNRIHQRVVMDVSSWPDVAPGTYWVQMSVTGAPSAFMSPVTVCGACGKTGANAFQLNVATWGALFDNTATGNCVGAVAGRQDVPFIVYGVAAGGSCDGDVDGDGDVDVDDLIAVILGWGCTGACAADVDGDGDVDVDDLIAVIINWGPC